MQINNNTSTYSTNTNVNSTSNNSNSKSNDNSSSTSSTNNNDVAAVYTPSTKPDTKETKPDQVQETPEETTEEVVTYSKNPNLTTEEVDAMMKQQEEEMQEFQKELMREIATQSQLAQSYGGSSDMGNLTMEILGSDTTEMAQKAIGEDGYYSAENTADRILDSAKAMSSGDPEEIAMLREATEQGFQNASQSAGGMENMPQITQDTYALVMQGFDEWEAEATGTTGN